MKKLLSLILLITTMAFQAIAEDPTNSDSQNIILETNYVPIDTTIHRAPMRINIEAFYNSEINAIDIIYNGETEGEVYLYLDDNVIAYDTQINTSLSVPELQGLYRIEIITETWIAYGSIRL